MITFMLPAYNEAGAIAPLVGKIREVATARGWPYRVVLVDDGSTDGTAGVARSVRPPVPLEVLTHNPNKGLGAAMRTGFEHCARTGAPGDVVVTMDSDDTMDPREAPALLARLDEGYDIVIASRFGEQRAAMKGLSLFRRVCSWGASWLMRLVFPEFGVRDYTCGYRAYRWETLKRGFDVYGERFIDQAGFVVMLDILLKLCAAGAKTSEVPFHLRYDRKQGGSKMRVLDNVLDTLRLLARRRFWSMRS
jgi:dolichol-phosphate mannosyltransferase